ITISGGVSEFVYGYEGDTFSDLGPQLASAVQTRIQDAGLRLMEPIGTIRATPDGASQDTLQRSGSSVFGAPRGALPLHNLPGVAPRRPPEAEGPDSGAIAAATEAALRRLDLGHGGTGVALCYSWAGSATFQRIDAFTRGICAGLAPVLENGHPLVLVGDG